MTQTKKQAVSGLTAVILMATFAYAFVNSITGVLVNEIVSAFSLTGALQGMLSSMLSMGLMLALLVNPLLQGRIGKLPMLLLSGLLQTTMLFLSGSSSSFPVFAFAIVFLGMGCGWLDGYANSCMIDLHPSDSAKYLGLLHGIFGIGSLLAPLLMQWLLPRVQWRGVHYAIAGMMFLVMACVALGWWSAGGIGALERTQEERVSWKQMGIYLKSGRNLLLLGCGAMCSMVQTGLICWIARYMLLVYGKDTLGAACMTIFWVAATINRFLAPHLRVKPLVLVMGGALLSALFLGVGILSGNAAVMCLSVGLIGLTSGHFQPMMIAECAKGYQGNTTLTTSVLMFVMGITRVVVPLLIAALSDAVSVQAGMSVPIVAGCVAALLAVLSLRLTAPEEGR